MLEGLVAIVVFCLLSAIVCFYVLHIGAYGKKANQIHQFLQYIHQPAGKKTAHLKCNTQSDTLVIPTPATLGGFVKEPICIEYTKVAMESSNKKDKKNVLYIF